MARLTYAATYHVSPRGSNTPPYDTYSRAAKTPGLALVAAQGTGDTVLVHSGTYEVETTLFVPAGVYLMGVDRDSVDFVWSGSSAEFQTILQSQGSSTIHGLELSNPNGDGVRDLIGVMGMTGNDSLVVSHCRFDKTYLETLNLVSAHIHHNEFIVWIGMGCRARADSVWIHHNLFASGEGNKGTGDGVYAASGNLLIEANVFDFRPSEGRGTPVSVDRAAHVTLRNNLMLGGSRSLWWILCPGEIENNTMIGPRSVLDGSLFIIQDINHTLTIRNNLFYDLARVPFFMNRCYTCPPTGPILYTYNAFWPPVDSFYAEAEAAGVGLQITDSANFIAYPMLTDDSPFALQAGSPLIDVGDPNVVDPDGSRSDVGWLGGPHGLTYVYEDLSPESPESLEVTAESCVVILHWKTRPEADLAGYRVYRGEWPGAWQPGREPIAITSSLDASLTDSLAGGSGPARYYTVTAFDRSGHESLPSIEVEALVYDCYAESLLPELLGVTGSYPNPANSETVILVTAPIGDASMVVEVIDVTGRRVAEAFNGRLSPGAHLIPWRTQAKDGSALASGVYFVRLVVSEKQIGKVARVVIVK